MSSKKKYDTCSRCKKKRYSWQYTVMCGKCYLEYKQEQREKKGLE